MLEKMLTFYLEKKGMSHRIGKVKVDPGGPGIRLGGCRVGMKVHSSPAGGNCQGFFCLWVSL